MKYFKISKQRWQNFRHAMLELGKGRFIQRLKIGNINDSFEGLEVLFNMVVEELRRRLLHLAFIKPAGFQRYSCHYVLITNENFKILNTCESFLTQYGDKMEQLPARSFLTMLDPEDASLFNEVSSKTTELLTDDLHHIKMFNDQFLCSVSRLAGNLHLVINLYQIRLQKEYFKATYEMTRTETVRLLENKRYYETIEKIKNYIEQLPLTVRVSMKEVVKAHGINSGLVKKLFKEQYGCGIYEYQISLRMDKAYYLISSTEKSFKEIAAETGYLQYSDFVKYFKQYYNILPGTLRKKHREE